LFWLAALASPLDLLQYIPGPGFSLLALIAILLVPLTLIDAIDQQKLCVPFEVWAPVRSASSRATLGTSNVTDFCLCRKTSNSRAR